MNWTRQPKSMSTLYNFIVGLKRSKVLEYMRRSKSKICSATRIHFSYLDKNTANAFIISCIFRRYCVIYDTITLLQGITICYNTFRIHKKTFLIYSIICNCSNIYFLIYRYKTWELEIRKLCTVVEQKALMPTFNFSISTTK